MAASGHDCRDEATGTTAAETTTEAPEETTAPAETEAPRRPRRPKPTEDTAAPAEAAAMTVTYTLSDAAVWNDGSPITCGDFECTWQAQLNTPGSLDDRRLRPDHVGHRR